MANKKSNINKTANYLQKSCKTVLSSVFSIIDYDFDINQKKIRWRTEFNVIKISDILQQ